MLLLEFLGFVGRRHNLGHAALANDSSELGAGVLLRRLQLQLEDGSVGADWFCVDVCLLEPLQIIFIFRAFKI